MLSLPSCSDYSTSIVVGSLVKASQLVGGRPEMYNGKPIKYAGGYCIVFPYIVSGKKYAVRCWHANLEGAKERTKIISSSLHTLNMPYFVGFEYAENGIATPLGVQPIVIMDWVEAKPLKGYIEEHLFDADSLYRLANNFLSMTQQLHEHSVSHGDLQHGNIMVKSDGGLVLVDYDSMYVPKLEGWTDEISGLPGYQHPARWTNKYLTPKADYFSEMVIYTSIVALTELPQLWQDLKVRDTDTLLFSADDINSKGESPIFEVLDSIDSCSDLVSQMRDALQCNSIDDITPLEINKKSIAESLSELWGDNGYKQKPSYEKADVVKVTSKW